MNAETEKAYWHIRNDGSGFYEQKRGLIAVWGKESVQFLDGMITNDVKTLEDGAQMLAAFPNAQGRLLAAVRIKRMGDRYLIETEDMTQEKLFTSLHRFTFAGDFFVGDTSEMFRCVEVFGNAKVLSAPMSFVFEGTASTTYFLPRGIGDGFVKNLRDQGGIEISDDLYETLRIENGIPKYGVDMDETTIVPELGLDGLISYNKGCYIGQEIIARIHFRGHVAKRLTGLTLDVQTQAMSLVGLELQTTDGKNAGRITSVTYSPKLDKTIALAFVRYDYLAEGTELRVGDIMSNVSALPFIS